MFLNHLKHSGLFPKPAFPPRFSFFSISRSAFVTTEGKLIDWLWNHRIDWKHFWLEAGKMVPDISINLFYSILFYSVQKSGEKRRKSKATPRILNFRSESRTDLDSVIHCEKTVIYTVKYPLGLSSVSLRSRSDSGLFWSACTYVVFALWGANYHIVCH